MIPMTSAVPAPVEAPSVARRLAARFALLAFGLYHVPLFLNAFPSFGGGGFRPDGLAHSWGHIFTPAGVWVARHVFHMTGPMSDAYEGDNGDIGEEYGRLLAGVVVAAVVAVIWTIADRRRPRAPWVEGALRVLLRYAIVLGLASYGMAKIFPVQFGQLHPISLETRVGELRPMGLLWRFMEYSPAYSMFAGIMEMLVVVLLCFRRTTTLGALICLPVMANVAMMNVCYGVPVKLFSIMMVVSAAVLVLYDAPRLFDVLVRHRTTPAVPPAPPFRSPRLNQVRWVLKLVVVGGVIVSSAVEMRRAVLDGAAAAAAPVNGTWDVESFVKSGQELAGTADPARWRRLVASRFVVGFRLENDQLLSCWPASDKPAGKLALSCRDDHKAELSWTRDGETLRLEGTFDGAPVVAVLKRRDESQYPLLRQRFRWMFD